MTPNSSFSSKSAGGALRRSQNLISRSTNKQHLLAGAVAVLFAISAFWYGGNPPEITAAISLVAWWSIVLGAVTGLLPLGNLDRRATIAIALFAAIAALTAFSITWSIDEGRAFVKTVQITSYLGMFVLFLFCSSYGSARRWAAGITGGLLFIVLLAAISRFLPGIGDDQDLTANLSGVQGRLSWPLGYWNAMGAAAAICAAGLTWFGVNARSIQWRSLAIASLPVVGLVIYLTSSRGAFVAVGLSVILLISFGPQRRNLIAVFAAGLIGGGVLVLLAASMTDLVHAENTSTADNEGVTLMVVTVIVSGLLGWSWRRIEPRVRDLSPWKPRLWQTLVGALIVLVALVAINPIQKIDDFLSPVPLSAIEPEVGENSTTSHLFSSSGTGRSEYWKTAINAFKDEPVRGIGAGSFETYYQNQRDSGLQGKHTHSLPLQILAELGLAGTILLLALVVLTIVTGWQRWQAGRLSRSAVFATTHDPDEEEPWAAIPVLFAISLAAGVSLAIDWTAEFPVIVASILIAIGCIVGPATRPGLASHRETERSIGSEILAVLAILGGGLAIWVSASGFGLATNLNASRNAVSNGDYALAASEARDAIDILPSGAEPRVQLALVQEAQGRYKQALRTVNEALDRAPNSSSIYLLKARILLKMNRDGESRMNYERAKMFDPKGQIFAFDVQESTPPAEPEKQKKQNSKDEPQGIVDSSRPQP